MKENKTYNSILIIVLGFIILFLVTEVYLFIKISISIGLISLISPFLAKKIEFLWFKLAIILSYIIPNILLTIVFYLFLTPISILSKLFGKNKNSLNLKNTESTLFKKVNKSFKRNDFEKTW